MRLKGLIILFRHPDGKKNEDIAPYWTKESGIN